MQTIFKKRYFIILTMIMISALVFTIPAYADYYHSIYVDYIAYSSSGYGGQWLSYGNIETSQTVDQIGTTFWSTLEYCDGGEIWDSYYSFNGSLNPQNSSYTNDFFRPHYGCGVGEENEFRTYIQFYVQDYPYDGEEWPDVGWATW